MILPTNQTHIEEISSEHLNGAIIYIVVVLIWYALGFGLILIDDLCSPADRRWSHMYANVYQTVSDLHEQQARNDILVELKDQQRRLKLWQIYYGTQKTHSTTIQKDNEAVQFINKQLDELHQRRQSLRRSLYNVSLDQDDDGHGHDGRSSKLNGIRRLNNSRSWGNFSSYFK